MKGLLIQGLSIKVLSMKNFSIKNFSIEEGRINRRVGIGHQDTVVERVSALARLGVALACKVWSAAATRSANERASAS